MVDGFYADAPLRLHLNEPCGRIFCGPGWERTRENSLNLRDWELWLVWRGRGWMRTAGGRHPLFAGFCALMRPGGIYDAGHDEADPLGITFIHFDVEQGRRMGRGDALPTAPAVSGAIPAKASAQVRHGAGSGGARRSLTAQQVSARRVVPSPRGPLVIDAEPAHWPEFFLLDDIEYADLLTSRIIELLDENLPAATALLHTFLMDLLEREPVAAQAWVEDAGGVLSASAEGAGIGTAKGATAVADAVGIAAAADQGSGRKAARGFGASHTTGGKPRAEPVAAVGSPAGIGLQRGLPHYRELRQLFARLRTTSPEALPSVAQMAAQAGLSLGHFSRLFRRANGQSPMQFIVSLRITHARHLLRESSLSVGEIAERLGYGDVYFFSRQFKEQVGVSPLVYRRQG